MAPPSASDAVAWSHYFPLPGVIEHKRRRPVDRHRRRLASYGGEEFIAALPAPDAAQALGLGGVGRRHGSRRLPAAEAHVTISVGVAWQAAHEQADPRGLVERADQALYRAKHAGRNCVHAAPALEAGEQHSDRRA
ncbi:hypothetical protein B9Y61_10700 [Stenotrophomonas maltophilia]|nr:hypothetical protein B9Y61_10700 [Stenotrophomonas maltophilia]